MSTHTLLLLLILFFATLIRSTFGFGEALIAVPLLALVIPITEAAPLAVLLSTTIALVVVVQDWRRIYLRSALWLLAPTVVGIPLGTALLASSHQAVVKGLLALTLIAFSAYVLLRAQMPRLHRDRRSWMLTCGFLAGVLGGAYGMNGRRSCSTVPCEAGRRSTSAPPCRATSFPPAQRRWWRSGLQASGPPPSRTITSSRCPPLFRPSFSAEPSTTACAATLS